MLFRHARIGARGGLCCCHNLAEKGGHLWVPVATMAAHKVRRWGERAGQPTRGWYKK